MVAEASIQRYNTRGTRIYVAVYVSLVVGSVVFAVLFSGTASDFRTILAKSALRVGFYVAILIGLHRVWTRFVAGAL